MAIENAITWEVNRKKRGFDLTQGQYLTWNWGVSEYLPLGNPRRGRLLSSFQPFLRKPSPECS